MIVWLTRKIIVAIHDEQLATHGGAAGLRDSSLLDSALARPANRQAYAAPDMAELAELYALAITRNHPFVDGNKRTGYVALELFLACNGHDFTASDAESVVMTLRMAAGDMSDEDFVAWVRSHAVARGRA